MATPKLTAAQRKILEAANLRPTGHISRNTVRKFYNLVALNSLIEKNYLSDVPSVENVYAITDAGRAALEAQEVV